MEAKHKAGRVNRTLCRTLKPKAFTSTLRILSEIFIIYIIIINFVYIIRDCRFVYFNLTRHTRVFFVIFRNILFFFILEQIYFIYFIFMQINCTQMVKTHIKIESTKRFPLTTENMK